MEFLYHNARLPGDRELLRAIDDFKLYTFSPTHPEANPAPAKSLRSILADGCDPEYWIVMR